MAKIIKANKTERLIEQVSSLVGAGKTVVLESVDFSNANRDKTCLEVDFPILPINEVAVIEGNADKPIYQVSKYWARRSSSVFRALLLAAASKAPDTEKQAGALIWKSFYGNHQKNEAFRKLKVADIFMGGGTTLVEAARLGMEVYGNDLNPMAWFVVKSELANAKIGEVKDLLANINRDVFSATKPYFAQDCPRGHKGVWHRASTGEPMPESFDPYKLSPSERVNYDYIGPELIYTFWAKHGPCQAPGCGHRTPLMNTPIFATKTLQVKAWKDFTCSCGKSFDVERQSARMAPGEPFVVAEDESPFAIMDDQGNFTCPLCGVVHKDHKAYVTGESINLGKSSAKKIDLTLMVHPDWLKGSPDVDENGAPLGGRADDNADDTNRWYRERSQHLGFFEIRGPVPETIVCPNSGRSFQTNIGTAPMKQTADGLQPKKATFACQESTCGRESDVLAAVRVSGRTGPMAAYAYHVHCPQCEANGDPYSGRSFVPARETKSLEAAEVEWASRKNADLAGFWPTSLLSEGWKTHKWGIPDHGYTHYWKMFNTRQLLVLSQLGKAITSSHSYAWEAREALLGAFQQYIRNENLLCFWNESADKMEPHFSGNNYSLKARPIENNLNGKIGRGNWRACAEGVIESLEWRKLPWERVTKTELARVSKDTAKELKQAKSAKVPIGDSVLDNIHLSCGSSTDLSHIQTENIDLVITDPPFSELVQYSELSDFFYVWLAPLLREKYPDIFTSPFTPKSLEAVENPYRQGKDEAKGFYQRLLTECWKEAYRILKPGGILAFTFHHSEDGPWVQVLESLFSAGFYLEATYPIRGDESKGESQFGSMKVEYDIVHVCRKRMGDPEQISWARLRRRIVNDIQQLKTLLEQHQENGLPKADLEVIKRGKALEYFSRHYGNVFVEKGREFTLAEALAGIRSLLDEDDNSAAAPPVIAEAYTRQFLRIFDNTMIVKRDQMLKSLQGTAIDTDVFEKLGWCKEDKKAKQFTLVAPLDFALAWRGKPRKGMSRDMDQSLFLIGACYPDSGIRVEDTLNNTNFDPHPAVSDLLQWMSIRGGSPELRRASQTAKQLFDNWLARNKEKHIEQLKLFDLSSEAL
jgi:adenine-specific DNA methylase